MGAALAGTAAVGSGRGSGIAGAEADGAAAVSGSGAQARLVAGVAASSRGRRVTVATTRTIPASTLQAIEM